MGKFYYVGPNVASTGDPDLTWQQRYYNHPIPIPPLPGYEGRVKVRFKRVDAPAEGLGGPKPCLISVEFQPGGMMPILGMLMWGPHNPARGLWDALAALTRMRRASIDEQRQALLGPLQQQPGPGGYNPQTWDTTSYPQIPATDSGANYHGPQNTGGGWYSALGPLGEVIGQWFGK